MTLLWGNGRNVTPHRGPPWDSHQRGHPDLECRGWSSCLSWGRTTPQKGNCEAPVQRASQSTSGVPYTTLVTCGEVSCRLFVAQVLLPAGLGLLQLLAAAPAAATHSLRDPGSAHDPSSRHPHRLQQKSHLARACNPSARNALTAEVTGGKKKRGEKKERERKKEQCAIGTALEMEKVLKACNIHQGWIHKCHILNKPSKRQWQRKGALLQESLSFSFAAVRNLFFASHSISHYSINEVTSHSYWLACQSPCLIP